MKSTNDKIQFSEEEKQKTEKESITNTYFFYNEDYLTERLFGLHINNRCFQYGDGLFETMVAEEGRIKYLEDHLERLFSGLEVLEIDKPNNLNEEFLQSVFLKLLKKNNYNNINEKLFKIKLQVWRKPGGLYTPTSNGHDFFVSAEEIKKQTIVKNKVSFYNDIYLSYSKISALKTCNALPYVLASIQKQKLGLDDMILCTSNGKVSECTASNIFWTKGKTLFTPNLKTGCISGVMRNQVIKKCRELEVEIKIGEFDKKNLLNANSVFTSNVTGLHPVNTIENTKFSFQIANNFIHLLNL